MENKGCSDRVWCTLLWEFMQFTKQRVWGSAFIGQTLSMMREDVVISKNQARELLNREDVLKAVQFAAPGLFLDFLRKYPEILGEDGLLRWVKSRQQNYPKEFGGHNI